MIKLEYLLYVVFIFLFFNNGIKNIEKVFYLCLAVIIVYYIINNIDIKKLIVKNNKLEEIIISIKKYDKIDINSIENDLRLFNKYSNLDNICEKNKMENMYFLKNRIIETFNTIYLNYNENEQIKNIYNKLLSFLENIIKKLEQHINSNITETINK
jgi:hypothetical protein